MGEIRGRRSEHDPLEYRGEPLCRLDPIDLTAEPGALVFLSPGWAERFKELTPRVTGPMTVEGEFSGTLYPEMAERLDKAIRALPEYCSICENFPCLANHPPGEGA